MSASNTSNTSNTSNNVPNEDVQPVVEESVVTPWQVKGAMDYKRLIEQFGTRPIDGDLIERWERVTKVPVHHMIRRGIVFSNQDFAELLDNVESGKPVYIYTGRGPSSDSMHTGHLVPFVLTKYLQDALNCIVVIQMSDDEKFLFKDGVTAQDLEYYHDLSRKNARDIIACGFDPEKTLIFSNLETNAGHLYFNNMLIANSLTMNQIKGTFGLGESIPENLLEYLKTVETDDEELANSISLVTKKFSSAGNTVGQCVWPAFQMGPAFCTSFTDIFVRAIKHKLNTEGDNMPVEYAKNLKKVLGEFLNIKKDKSMACVITMAIDQSPYFRGLRDISERCGFRKCAELHSEFLPGLCQSTGKMSSTDNKKSTVFLDMDPKEVQKVIKRHAFSGGRPTLEEHRSMGGDIRIDVCYQYLTFFLDDDVELERIAREYSDGTLTAGELKEYTGNVVAEVIRNHQENKSEVTDDVVATFFDQSRTLDIGGIYDRPELAEHQYMDYSNYGISFDRTFNCVPKCERE